MLNLEIDKDVVFVFDLDDTLYKEFDFLCSGFRLIAQKCDEERWNDLYRKMIAWYKSGVDVFDAVLALLPKCPISKENMIDLYRNHAPDISLSEDVKKFFQKVESNCLRTALISDGRSITQRNKIRALGLDSFFQKIVISEELGSEKPDVRNFVAVQTFFCSGCFFYFGDNYKKDFIAPNKLGWTTVALLNDGSNIHKANGNILENQKPKFEIKEFGDIEFILKGS